jgi:CRISPR-associated endonuclease/helicase Cas3
MHGNDKSEEQREFYAHSLPDRPPREWQKLEDHLLAVAQRAEQFGQAFGAGEWAYLACLWYHMKLHKNE